MINSNCITFSEFNHRIKILEDRLLKAKMKIEYDQKNVISSMRENSEISKKLPLIVSNVQLA
jgi:hypothetical protein